MIYRYACVTGITGATVNLWDESIEIEITTQKIPTRARVMLNLSQVFNLGPINGGAMLAVGERQLTTACPNWIDLKAAADHFGSSIPQFIQTSALDSYPIRVLLPSQSISSLRQARVMLFMQEEASLITNEQVHLVSGPCKSRALLDELVLSYHFVHGVCSN